MLVAAWIACFVLSVRSMVSGVALAPVIVSGSTGAGGYPIVSGITPGWREEGLDLRLGDRLIRVQDFDLRDVGRLEFLAVIADRTRGDPETRVTFERAGAQSDTALHLDSRTMSWPLVLVSFVFAATGILLVLRAPPSPLVPSISQALLFGAIATAATFGSSLRELYLSSAALVVSATFFGPLTLRAIGLFPSGVGPTGRFARFGPWCFAAFGLLALLFVVDAIPYDPWLAAWNVLSTLFAATILLVGSRKYLSLDPLGRRQARWIVLGLYAAVLARVASTAWLSFDPGRLQFQVYVMSFVTLSFVPLSLLVAVARYNLFDVDRLLSATASYHVVVVALVGAGLAIVPWVGELSSEVLGVSPRAGQLAVSLLLAAVVVPAHQRLRPWIDRTFFKERYALECGIAELLQTVSRCENARTLSECVGEELQRLLRPEACVVYATAGEAFVPVFVQGSGVPPAFEAGSPLVATLRSRRAPLALSSAGRRPDAPELGPFDRAALEALAAEVVLPVRAGEQLYAILCLGPKRSGDVYTPTDLVHLASVAEAMSSRVGLLGRDAVIREERAMRESLRRYVPAAIAEELASGAELGPAERDVTVLFVDLRGYSSFAEPLRAGEVFSTVNRYTETVSELVRQHGGSVVEFNGDGMMAVFGAPRNLAQKERAAVHAGREIAIAVGALPIHDTKDEAARLSVGVGIATGAAFVGSIRAADRMIWSAIGNTTNLAARLQGLTRELDAALVIDEATWEELGVERRDFDRHEGMAIRGRSKVETLYSLSCAPTTASLAGRR